ncbi:phage tail protein [Bacillus sp. ISL-35]|uniref:phage tail spike protein n=1 Tax=Bacillus sp. ISL-35 TaxID=2819122 RepID=UPI001BEB7437|nr:phage tail spike protein [Bacillus sp. ISL-35]MBT2680057.1 phage tail protein [Bacillus sp. ISL-35]MBT2702966.1 phage tail protein [Chryseobacterium sp. ISL-80]
MEDKDLLIFDSYDNLVAILSNEAAEACAFWNAPFKEILNNGSTFEFSAQGDHEDSQYLVAENQVAFMDKDGYFRLFVIKEPEKTNGQEGPQIRVVTEPAMLELNDEPLEDIRPYDTTVDDALLRALQNTRWEVGETAELGLNSTNFYYINAREAIEKILNTWGGELRDRVEIDGNKIIGRYIDILPRRGQDIGKVWEIDKDILFIKHKVLSYPKTALYGRGSSLETDNEGYTRKVTFADVEWSTVNGDPVDKPMGQEWVGDAEALEAFGRLNSDGTKRHRFGFYDDDSEDPTLLLQRTWNALQEQKNQIENFELDTFLLGDLIGYEHEKVRLGDTTRTVDRSFAAPIEVQTRVVVFEYDVADPDNAHVEMGQYLNLFEDDERLDMIEAKLNDKAPIWDKNTTQKEISDTDFPDVPPPVPTSFTAKGLFKTIKLNWDFIHELYIAAYEVYASQVQNFIPGDENLVFRGKSSGVIFESNTDEQWYFRARTINTHGTASEFTNEISAQTARVSGQDIVPLTITNELIAEGVSADKVTTGTLKAIAIEGVTITGSVFMSTNGNFQVDDNGIMMKENLKMTTLDELGLTGWYDATGNENWEKVFYLNEDETVTKKVRAEEEFTMGGIKIIKMPNGAWAFVPTI